MYRATGFGKEQNHPTNTYPSLCTFLTQCLYDIKVNEWYSCGEGGGGWQVTDSHKDFNANILDYCTHHK